MNQRERAGKLLLGADKVKGYDYDLVYKIFTNTIDMLNPTALRELERRLKLVTNVFGMCGEVGLSVIGRYVLDCRERGICPLHYGPITRKEVTSTVLCDYLPEDAPIPMLDDTTVNKCAECK